MEGKVLVTAAYFLAVTDEGARMLEEAGLTMVLPEGGPRPLKKDELLQCGKDAVAVVASVDPYSADVLDQLTELKVISRFGVGYDSVDVEAATARGITVCTTPGTLHDSVADHTVGLMLASARGTAGMDGDVRRGVWRRPKQPGVQVYGKTLGIIGLGTIGRAVAKRLKGFDMRIVGFDPYASGLDLESEGITRVELDELLSQSDFVTLHVPLTPATHHVIGRRELALMKPTAHLINTARGEVVDQDALYEALKDGVIAGAGLDVFHPEPPGDHPLVALPNVVSTTHIAGLTQESCAAMARVSAENVLGVLRGERVVGAVNQPVEPKGRSRS